MRRVATAFMALVMVAGACSSGGDSATTTTRAVDASTTSEGNPDATSTSTDVSEGSSTTQGSASTTVPGSEPAARPVFAALPPAPLLDSGPAYAGPQPPTNLADVEMAERIATTIEAADAEDVADKLIDNGFVVVPGTTRQFHHIYEAAAYEAFPVFLTTDTAYHVWHLAFSKVLREVESQTLLPELENMVSRLVELSRQQESELAGNDLAEAANRVTQFYEVAAELLGLDVGPIGPLAQAEVELILAADQIAVSPTTGGDAESGFITRQIDYSLFRPRGHYTRSNDLERYFRAMSQLGNNAFLIDDGLQLGMLASRVVMADPDVIDSWRRIYEPTAWLVGAADDYTPIELGSIVDASLAGGWSDLAALMDPATVASIGEALLESRPVAINPEAASLRIMGSRFVIDAYILDQLVMPNVDGRTEASGLDVAAALGSDWALSTQTAAGETEYAGYVDQLDAMRDLTSSRDEDDWAATVYDTWLWALQPMWASKGEEYPEFMRGDAWQAKAHQTGLSSYAELKHDTILYTKQAVAEAGFEEPPDPPRHWVEPAPVAFERLAGLAEMMKSGLESRDLLPADYSLLLDDLAGLYSWLAQIARDELAGLAISPQDNDRLRFIGGELESFWVRTSDADIDFDNGPDSFAAVISDVMRNAESVLQLGTGHIDEILVLVPDDEGNYQVALGAVYSYYEFWNDDQRLTDEEWRTLLDSGSAPARPSWQQVFLADSPARSGVDVSTLEPGLFCRDLVALGLGPAEAVAYWLAEGSPDRMDADRNGVPCETLFPTEELLVHLP